MFTLYTFGDSILDCGHYNAHGVTPGGLLVKNADAFFPDFAGRDLATRGPARLVHRARDGATVDTLSSQSRGLAAPDGPAAALVTVGGNDLLAGLAGEPGDGPAFAALAAELDAFLDALPVRPVLLGSVYDPTFGDDGRNFLGIPPEVARASLARVNALIAAAARRLGAGRGAVVDLHSHFLTGNSSWFVNVIEPSLVGASEVRRAFWQALMPDD